MAAEDLGELPGQLEKLARVMVRVAGDAVVSDPSTETSVLDGVVALGTTDNVKGAWDPHVRLGLLGGLSHAVARACGSAPTTSA